MERVSPPFLDAIGELMKAKEECFNADSAKSFNLKRIKSETIIKIVFFTIYLLNVLIY